MNAQALTPAQYDLLRRANLASIYGLHHTARAFKAMARRLPSGTVPLTTTNPDLPFTAPRPALKPAA